MADNDCQQQVLMNEGVFSALTSNLANGCGAKYDGWEASMIRQGRPD